VLQIGRSLVRSQLLSLEFFIYIKSDPTWVPGGFSGGKSGRCVGWQSYCHPAPLLWNLGILTSWNPLGHSRPVTGLLYLHPLLLEAESTPGLQFGRKDQSIEKFQWHHRKLNPQASGFQRSASINCSTACPSLHTITIFIHILTMLINMPNTSRMFSGFDQVPQTWVRFFLYLGLRNCIKGFWIEWQQVV